MKRLIVNLTDEGRIIQSKAHLNKKKERPLYWFVEPIGSDNSKLEFLQRAHRAGFGTNASPKVMLMTNSDGVCEHREFRLSVCGKDKFKVSVGLKRDGSDKITDETYEVWRRIYFSVRYMSSTFLFNFDPIHTEYRKHGIWPIEIAPAGGARVRYTKVLETRERGLNLAQAVTETHLEARIVLVDRLWISAQRHFRIRHANVNHRFTLRKSRSAPAGAPDPEIWPLGSVDSILAGTANGIDIAQFATRSGTKRLRFDFSSNPDLAAAAARGDLTLDFRVKERSKVLNGVARSDDGRIVIATRTKVTDDFRPVGPRQGTMIHEMGHGLDMVPSQILRYNEFNGNVIPGTPADRRNPTYYQNGGGHCSTAATGTTPNFDDGTCVMFHYGHDARTKDFCVSCAPIVKRNNLNRIEMLWP